jgi:N-formylmaleamate deformylase
MVAWQSGDVEVNGLTLHYTRTGGDKPQVVLAHGFSDDGLCWTPVAERLAADYAADLAGLIEALQLQRPAVLGHSMGAATALVLAGVYPNLPRAILLEDPPPRWMPPDPADSGARRAFGDRIIALKRKTREELVAHQRDESPKWSEAELGPWADAKLRLSFHVLNRGESLPVDWPATVQQITCPVLLITADPDLGAIVPAASAAALKKRLPQTQVVNIPKAGHNIRREQFERYMDVITGYLAETAV